MTPQEIETIRVLNEMIAVNQAASNVFTEFMNEYPELVNPLVNVNITATDIVLTIPISIFQNHTDFVSNEMTKFSLSQTETETTIDLYHKQGYIAEDPTRRSMSRAVIGTNLFKVLVPTAMTLCDAILELERENISNIFNGLKA